MKCSEIHCVVCQNRSIYSDILKTDPCDYLTGGSGRFQSLGGYEQEIKIITFEQFLSLITSYSIDAREKKFLQRSFPEYVEKLKTL